MRLPCLKGRHGRSKNLVRTALAAVVGAAVGYQTPALAQDDIVLVLEEIIVTASKKDELLSDVAETVNVVTGEKLQQFNIFSFKDLETLTPGLSLKNFDARNSGIALRGTPYDPDSATDATVVTYWNGIAVRSNIAFNQLFDIQRIEILRGAQGTLQGDTSPSGSIQIHTKRGNPDAVEFNAQQTVDDNDSSITEIGGSIPLIDGILGLRVAGVLSDNGLYDLEAINKGLTASSNSRAGRINLNWLPNDDLEVSLTHEYLERFTDGLEAVEGSDQSSSGDPLLGSFDRISLQEGQSDVVQRHNITALEFNWLTYDHVLTSLTGYQNVKNFAFRDTDIGNNFPGFEQNQLVDSSFEVWTQEFRITNDSPDFWEYIFGAYYNESRSFTYNTNLTPAFFTDPTPTAPSDPVFVTSTESLIPVVSEKAAFFTDNKFYLTDETTLQVGLRWQKTRGFREIKTFAREDIPGSALAGEELLPEGISEDQKRSKSTTWTGSIKLAHDWNEEVTIYTSVSNGYRPAGITISPTSGVSEDLLLYDEEKSTSLELGFKSQLENGRYQVNGAIYYQQYKDFQNRSANLFLDLDDPADGVLETPILGGINYNADAIIRGAEIEATALITADWVVFAGASYNDSKFDDADAVPCGDGGDIVSVPGSQANFCSSEGRLGPEPNWSVSANSEYTIPEVTAGIDAYIRTLYKFTDNRVDDFAAVNSDLYDKFNLGGYGTWDLYVGLRSETNKGDWDVSIWVRNLFDKEAKADIGFEEVANNRVTNQLLSSGYSTVSVIPEQTVGITAKYRFSEF